MIEYDGEEVGFLMSSSDQVAPMGGRHLTVEPFETSDALFEVKANRKVAIEVKKDMT